MRNSYSMEIRARDGAEPFTTKDGSTIRELARAEHPRRLAPDHRHAGVGAPFSL
jgi:hypothetical protein